MPADLPPVAQQYATRVEVEQALNGLTPPDYAKLMIIAASYCRQRRLSLSVCEPKELLNQAVLKTLECDEGKRWTRSLAMVRHLDRAMENISGHLVRERAKIVAFPDGLRPETDGANRDQEEDTASDPKASELLDSVFGKDSQARQVFLLRAEGFRPTEIQASLAMDATAYETINRRILRRIAQFVNLKSK